MIYFYVLVRFVELPVLDIVLKLFCTNVYFISLSENYENISQEHFDKNDWNCQNFRAETKTYPELIEDLNLIGIFRLLYWSCLKIDNWNIYNNDIVIGSEDAVPVRKMVEAKAKAKQGTRSEEVICSKWRQGGKVVQVGAVNVEQGPIFGIIKNPIGNKVHFH